MTQLQAKLVD